MPLEYAFDFGLLFRYFSKKILFLSGFLDCCFVIEGIAALAASNGQWLLPPQAGVDGHPPAGHAGGASIPGRLVRVEHLRWIVLSGACLRANVCAPHRFCFSNKFKTTTIFIFMHQSLFFTRKISFSCIFLDNTICFFSIYIYHAQNV